jgi:hypothetical protein
MSEQSDPYVLGGTQTEQQRLLAQASEFEIQSRWLLDQIDIRPGWRAVDIGCGPIGILNLLSERVGIEGSVVGLEREAVCRDGSFRDCSARPTQRRNRAS